MSFLEIWKRICSETEIKKLNQLADLVDTTQQFISRKKSKNDFSVEWAYKVGRKYNLLTEWILTGEGPKRLNDQAPELNYKFPILNEVEQWLSEVVVNEPQRRDWFTVSLEDSFPMFREWRKKRENKLSES
jgi:hypothetical protein